MTRHEPRYSTCAGRGYLRGHATHPHSSGRPVRPGCRGNRLRRGARGAGLPARPARPAASPARPARRARSCWRRPAQHLARDLQPARLPDPPPVPAAPLAADAHQARRARPAEPSGFGRSRSARTGRRPCWVAYHDVPSGNQRCTLATTVFVRDVPVSIRAKACGGRLLEVPVVAGCHSGALGILLRRRRLDLQRQLVELLAATALGAPVSGSRPPEIFGKGSRRGCSRCRPAA